MAKAKRPIFVPLKNGSPFVKEVIIEFEWYPGFALTQAQKSISALHRVAQAQSIYPVLEISSKSESSFGVSLSAFNLKLEAPDGNMISVECAFQGSKIFQRGGPYTDLYFVSSKEAKQDERLRNSGDLVGFRFFGSDFPIKPTTAFYDRLYLSALWQNPVVADKLMTYNGFSDIAFNPQKSLNCQARSAALFVALKSQGLAQQAIEDRDYYLRLFEKSW